LDQEPADQVLGQNAVFTAAPHGRDLVFADHARDLTDLDLEQVGQLPDGEEGRKWNRPYGRGKKFFAPRPFYYSGERAMRRQKAGIRLSEKSARKL